MCTGIQINATCISEFEPHPRVVKNTIKSVKFSDESKRNVIFFFFGRVITSRSLVLFIYTKINKIKKNVKKQHIQIVNHKKISSVKVKLYFIFFLETFLFFFI